MKQSYMNLRWCLCIAVVFSVMAFGASKPERVLLPNVKVLFETGFEAGQPELKLSRHRVVKGVARTGEHSISGEVSESNQAVFVDVPFQSAKGKVVRVSYWVRSDKRSACATFVRVDDQRIRIRARVDSVPNRHWQEVVASYRPESDVVSAVMIAAPSSHNAPVGKIWIDDIKVVEFDDECAWPEHVQDFPALAADASSRLWLAAIERPSQRRSIRIDRIVSGNRHRVCVLAPQRCTGIGAPAIAGLNDGCVVVFPVEQKTRWRIAYAFVDGEESKPPIGYVHCEGNANISPAVAVVDGRVCAVWESNAGNARSIYACWIDKGKATVPQRISYNDANGYNPTVAATAQGSVLAAWDTVRNKQADIHGAWFRDGRWERPHRMTSDPRIERHPFLAAKKNAIWMTWQAQSYKDRRVNNVTEQRIVVAKIDGDRLLSPRQLFSRVSPDGSLLLRPRVSFDAAGRLVLTARQSIGRAGWRAMAWCYSGDTWSDPICLMEQQGRWRSVPVIPTADGVAVACQYDDIVEKRPYHGIHQDWRSGIAFKSVPADWLPPAQPLQLQPLKMPATDFSLADKIALCSAELPRQHIRHGQKELALFWGDLHEHTDLSICARSTNPPGHDLFANVRDIERLDFCALTDHGFDFDSSLWIYNGEQTRNNHDPGRFVTFLGQEWTSSGNPPAEPGEPNRYGHHNLVYLSPYYGRFHDSWDGDISPRDLWKQLEGIEFVCIPHQLADWQHKGKGNPPTDWNYFDEKLQPVAEIFQNRQSYEYLGCPRQAKHGAPFKGYYLQDAWERGVIIGTIASPDHGGGCGKVGVWAEALTRESIFRAIQARHTFGTSGSKMSLLFRAGDVMMGDKVQRPEVPIRFEVRAVAMHDIAELVIFRNNEIVHRVEPGEKTVKVQWTDRDPPETDRLWYYTRIHAADDELAWSSPIWFMSDAGGKTGSR